MKKFVFAIALLFSLTSAINGFSQEHRVKYYYYPSSNVYYNASAGEYWYYDAPTVKWVEVKTLPATIIVEKTPAYTVYYNGPDVWKENAMHQKKYKGKKNNGKHYGK
jgi:hypothetical protein